MDQKILVSEAQKIAREGNWTPINNCARVVAEVLTAATIATTGAQIDIKAPDGFDIASEFYQPAAGRVNIKAALDELRSVPLQISGEWRGTYRYDDRARVGEVVGFTLTVNQQGSEITGRVRDSEVGSASIVGTFNAETMQIYFTKIYGDDKSQVAYNGAVSGNTAAGRWHIGDYAGSWEMHR